MQPDTSLWIWFCMGFFLLLFFCTYI